MSLVLPTRKLHLSKIWIGVYFDPWPTRLSRARSNRPFSKSARVRFIGQSCAPLQNCVTTRRPIRFVQSSMDVLFSCHKGFPWWKRRADYLRQIPESTSEIWRELFGRPNTTTVTERRTKQECCALIHQAAPQILLVTMYMILTSVFAYYKSAEV